MKKYDFELIEKEKLAQWRIKNISSQKLGTFKGEKYGHIIPSPLWKENLYKEIRVESELPKYIIENNIQPHTGVNNLLSSWINCANLYYSIRQKESLKEIMTSFLQNKVSEEIIEVLEVELEFAFNDKSSYHPSNLLGETGGKRGSGQTSPDVAFIVKTRKGKGIVLTECKYTEHSFYGCSARKIDVKKERVNNPDPKRCMQSANNCDFNKICHQTVWGRKYFEHIQLSDFGKIRFKRCPAATAGYQIFRQQALAEGLANSSEFDVVASTVAFDERNAALKTCLKSTGVSNFQTEWGKLFVGKALFKVWTHQEWIQFVRENQKNGEFDEWLLYLKERYGY